MSTNNTRIHRIRALAIINYKSKYIKEKKSNSCMAEWIQIIALEFRFIYHHNQIK